MKNTIVVRTEHLTIYPVSDEEMYKLIAAELDMDMKQAYSEMLDGVMGEEGPRYSLKR